MVKIFEGFLSHILLGREYFGPNSAKMFALFKISASFLSFSLNQFSERSVSTSSLYSVSSSFFSEIPSIS